MKIPQHIAIIMDGNGRWAKAQGKPRSFGHKAGADNVEVICRAAKSLGVKYLTMYTFSTENWSRPKDEVETLMKLIRQYLKKFEKTAIEEDMRIRIIGDRTKLSRELLSQIDHTEKVTGEQNGMQLLLAINYGSRDEMIRAMRLQAKEVADGALRPEDITETSFAAFLDAPDVPDPDFLIRTSGEARLSNYLLWQLAYSEFYFTDVPWPAFSPEELKIAVEAYDGRDRRFGGVHAE
ncbi:MAG: isoprenyl transferase [Lachnospiraceae bacterium]|nr:isoprenyl transferase [Lachnospiraceae bacterium]